MITHEETLELDSQLTPSRSTRLSWDTIGVFGSVLCLIHCLSFPILVGYFSLAGFGFLGNEFIHQVLAFVLIPVALLAFIPAYKQHRQPAIVVAATLGIGLLLASGFLPESMLPGPSEWIMTMAGSLVLVGTHIANHRLRTACC